MDATLPTAVSVPRRQHVRALAGLGLVSCSSLLVELGLTRMFSVVLFYHFAFFAISVAMLGLGAGGLAVMLRADAATIPSLPRLRTTCLLSAGGVLLVLLVVLHARIPLEISWRNFLRLSLLYCVAAIPFYCNGRVIAELMTGYAAEAHRFYAADLGGAAAACLALVPLMNGLGGPSALTVAAALAVAAAWCFPSERGRRAVPVLLALLLILAIGNQQGRWFDIEYAKGSKREHIEYRRWNSFSRVEVRSGGVKDILIDSDADTAMVGVSLAQARSDAAVRADFLRYSAALPYVLRPGASTLIIGPGGGYDVMRALLGGSRDVTAVEINPIIVRRIMQGRYRDWTHGLYLLPQVHAVVSDGRSYVRRSPRHYEVLQATMVDTWASTAAGALALSESNLYTVQAFREYLRHLQPDGVLALTRWEFQRPREALRVVSTAMQALRKEFGVEDPRGYFLLVSDGPLRRFGVTVTTLIGRRPFSAADVRRIRAYAAAHPPLMLQYAPGMQWGNGPGEVSPKEPNAAYLRLLQSGDAAKFARAYPYDVSPATDDRPFFFYTTRTAAILGLVHPAGKAPMDWKTNLALFLLLSLLTLSIVAVLLFLFVPLWVRRMRVQRGSQRDLLYFLCLGLGYILVEMALIQRFGLFLGHPTYALTVVIFGLLAGSSLGSRFGSTGSDPMARTRRALPVLVLLLGLGWWQLGAVLQSALAWPLSGRILFTLALLLVPAFLMGMPFSAGIRWLGRKQQQMVPWAWAVNAAAGVLGSVLAIFLAIHFGMDWTLASGALCYLLAELLSLQERDTASAGAGLAARS